MSGQAREWKKELTGIGRKMQRLAVQNRQDRAEVEKLVAVIRQSSAAITSGRVKEMSALERRARILQGRLA